MNRPSGLKYNIAKPNPGWFVNGTKPWNKGTKGVSKPNSGSIKPGEHRSLATEFTSERMKGNNFSSYRIKKPKVARAKTIKVKAEPDTKELFKDTLWGQAYRRWERNKSCLK